MAKVYVACCKLDPPYPWEPTNYDVQFKADPENGRTAAIFKTSVPLDTKDSKNKAASVEYVIQEAYSQVKADIAAFLLAESSKLPWSAEPFAEDAAVQLDIAAKKAK